MHFDDFVMEGACMQAMHMVIGNNITALKICYDSWLFIIFTLDGFHKKRRPNKEKANKPSSYYCHDEGYFKRSSSDLLMNITKTKVSIV